MSGVSRVYRLLRLIMLLQAGRSFTVRELASELGVSRRTIFRDMNMLELAGIPYFFDPDSGGYRIREHFFLPPVNLTITEALAVLTMSGRLSLRGQLPLLDEARRAAMKLETALPPPMRKEVGGVIKSMSVSLGPLAGHQGLDVTFDNLMRAIAARRLCRMVYISFAERKQLSLIVRPLRLVFVNRAWYLIAYAARFRGIRTFKLGRIKRLEVTSATFSQPKKADPDKYFGAAWSMIPEGKVYDVHLHFEPKVAGNVAEVRWHKSQKVTWNDDGSIEFYVHVDGLGEITWWILGYGDQVKVVGPPALRANVAKIASAVAARYTGEGR